MMGALLWLLAHVLLISSNPVVRYFLLRLIERDRPVAHHAVELVFQPVFYFAIPKEGIFRLRPQIADFIRAAKFFGDKVVDFVRAGDGFNAVPTIDQLLGCRIDLW